MKENIRPLLSKPEVEAGYLYPTGSTAEFQWLSFVHHSQWYRPAQYSCLHCLASCRKRRLGTAGRGRHFCLLTAMEVVQYSIRASNEYFTLDDWQSAISTCLEVEINLRNLGLSPRPVDAPAVYVVPMD